MTEDRLTEDALRDLFARVLGAPVVGPNDNFFQLGGDSLAAMRLASAARDRGLRVATIALFEYPTPRALAAVLDGDTADAPELADA